MGAFRVCFGSAVVKTWHLFQPDDEKSHRFLLMTVCVCVCVCVLRVCALHNVLCVNDSVCVCVCVCV